VEKFPARGQGLEARSGQLGVGVGGLAAGVEDFGAALPPHMAERLRLSGKVFEGKSRLRLGRRHSRKIRKEASAGKPEAYRHVRRPSRVKVDI